MSRPPPLSTLFPYTTLFRSTRHRPKARPARTRPAACARTPRGATDSVHGNSGHPRSMRARPARSEEHTSELQSRRDLVCRLLLEKKKNNNEIRNEGKDQDEW